MKLGAHYIKPKIFSQVVKRKAKLRDRTISQSLSFRRHRLALCTRFQSPFYEHFTGCKREHKSLRKDKIKPSRNRKGLFTVFSVQNQKNRKKYFSMRFVQFRHKENIQKLGIQIKLGGDIVDLSGADSSFPNSLIQFLSGGKFLWDKVDTFEKKGLSMIPLNEVKLLPPISSPDKIACVGLNYKGHCEENHLPLPKEPVFFSKYSSCIIGPFDSIKYPVASDKMDWEVELAVIIGKKGYDIPESQAMDHVFGYTIAQDISARDWQKTLNGGQFLLGKSMDTFCPLGPAVVTKDSIPDVYDLNLRTIVNGHVKQESNTSDFIHKIDKIISRFSKCITLLPGDIILTGTPAGVGACRNPPEFLKPGDIIRSEIDHIGSIENRVIRFQ